MVTHTSRVLSFPAPRVPVQSGMRRPGDEALLGPSGAIARVWAQIRRVAPHFRAALVTSEPHCGAEAAARALHALSPASRLPFAVLTETEAAVAFSATATAENEFREGVAFFPAMDRLSPQTQRAILRRLKQRGHMFRIVGATQTDLRACVSTGSFLPELAEALGAVRLTLPSLRERPEDICVLAGHVAQRVADRFARRAPVLSDDFCHAAAGFAWPGNLAQLDRVLAHAISHTHHAELSADDFQAGADAAPATPEEPDHRPRLVRLDTIVQEHIRSVLIACHGNKLRAAEVLGISRSTLYRMLDTGAAVSAITMMG